MAAEGRGILPRNLTARAAHRVVGNPDVTGQRTRWLFFNFVARTDTDAPWSEPLRYGAQPAYIDPHGDRDMQQTVVAQLDKDLRTWIERLATALLSALSGAVGNRLSVGDGHVQWIEQLGRRIDLMQALPDGAPAGLDGLFVWRLVRSLEPAPVTIALHQRHSDPPVVLRGWRRSPWQHDAGDCNCHYWLANRPDIVHIAGCRVPAWSSGRS